MSKEIVLISLALHNFKGIKDLKINFTHVTNIYGENGTGKTTVPDAFNYLLFDKDSHDRTVGDKEANFQIKTYDSTGQILHGLDHEVIGVLSIDGRQLTLQKTYREKWTKKRGEADKELTGHETLYYIDDVPVKKGEYQDKVSSLIGEDLFKLITNPLYFSAGMKWQDRRSTLMNIIGDVTPDRIISYKPNLRSLEALLVDKDIDTLKRSLAARRKKLNDDIKAIPFRIDELNNSIKEVDFEFLERQVVEIKATIQNLDERILDSSKANDGVLKDRQRLFELKSKLQTIEQQAQRDALKPLEDIDRKLYEHKGELSKLKYDLLSKQGYIDAKKEAITQYEAQKDELREKYKQESLKQLELNEADSFCPTCNRPFEEHEIEAKREVLQQNFNETKARMLQIIQQSGFKLRDKTDALQKEIEAIEQEKAAIELTIDNINNSIADLEKFKAEFSIETIPLPPETIEISEEIQALEKNLQQPAQASNNLELKALKSRRMVELESVNKQLAYKEQNENFRKRIAELKEQEKALGQQIAALEGQEYLCEEFIKTKVELLESSINSKFKYVSFKLFDTQVNGGLTETCEALINGVPFSNANTASQINAGLDIINALSEQYGVSAPVFIDNRESVNQIIECGSQVINLIVSQDKALRVEEI